MKALGFGAATLAGMFFAASLYAGGHDPHYQSAPPIAPPPELDEMSGVYVASHGGIADPGGDNFFSSQVRTGYQLGGEIGYKYDAYRFAGEITYFHNKLKSDGSDHVAMLAYMVNAYYDFVWVNSLSPFLGAGIGFSHPWETVVPAGQTRAVAHEVQFSYQAMAGLNYNFGDFVLGLDYRIFGWGGSSSAFQHVFEVSLAYYL